MSSHNHTFDIKLAREFGIEEALLIHHFQYWIGLNKKRKKAFQEGRTWTFQTYQEIADHFPYLSYAKVRHAIDNLVKHNIIIRKNLNNNPMVKTPWFAFVDEEAFSINSYDCEISHTTVKNDTSTYKNKDTRNKDNNNNRVPEKQNISIQDETSNDAVVVVLKKVNFSEDEIKLLAKWVKECGYEINEIEEAAEIVSSYRTKPINRVGLYKSAIKNNYKKTPTKEESSRENKRKVREILGSHDNKTLNEYMISICNKYFEISKGSYAYAIEYEDVNFNYGFQEALKRLNVKGK